MTQMPRSSGSGNEPTPSNVGALIVSWLVVGLPLAWGVYQTILKSLALFH